MVNALLQGGADRDLTCSNGWRALDWAHHFKAGPEVLEALSTFPRNPNRGPVDHGALLAEKRLVEAYQVGGDGNGGPGERRLFCFVNGRNFLVCQIVVFCFYRTGCLLMAWLFTPPHRLFILLQELVYHNALFVSLCLLSPPRRNSTTRT